eukprot:g2334.t1
MALTPLNTPIHTSPRSRRTNTSTPGVPTAFVPTPSAQPARRILSPTHEEASSPTAENFPTFFSNSSRNLSSSSNDFGEKIVEDVLESESREEPDEEGFLLGQDLLAAVLRPIEENQGLGWKGWLGVGLVGAISFGAVIVAGQVSKGKSNEERKLYYHLG